MNRSGRSVFLAPDFRGYSWPPPASLSVLGRFGRSSEIVHHDSKAPRRSMWYTHELQSYEMAVPLRPMWELPKIMGPYYGPNIIGSLT